MGSILMPKMRRRIPVKTGALRRSLKIVIERNHISVGFTPEGYYYLFQRGLPRDLINLWIDAVHDHGSHCLSAGIQGSSRVISGCVSGHSLPRPPVGSLHQLEAFSFVEMVSTSQISDICPIWPKCLNPAKLYPYWQTF